jgi:hypothetical protein
LSRQYCGLIVVEQGKQGNSFQNLWAARHRSPRQAEMDRLRSVQKDCIKDERQQLVG